MADIHQTLWGRVWRQKNEQTPGSLGSWTYYRVGRERPTWIVTRQSPQWRVWWAQGGETRTTGIGAGRHLPWRLGEASWRSEGNGCDSDKGRHRTKDRGTFKEQRPHISLATRCGQEGKREAGEAGEADVARRDLGLRAAVRREIWDGTSVLVSYKSPHSSMPDNNTIHSQGSGGRSPTWAKIRWAGLRPLGKLRRRICSRPLPASRGAHVPGLLAPPPTSKPSSHLSLTLPLCPFPL